jgi:hypothetical protein
LVKKAEISVSGAIMIDKTTLFCRERMYSLFNVYIIHNVSLLSLSLDVE